MINHFVWWFESLFSCRFYPKEPYCLTKYTEDATRNKFITIRVFINWKGVIMFKKINWSIGTHTIGLITAKALIGNSYVATFSPNTSTNPGPAIVDIPLLVNTRRIIRVSKAGLELEKIPIILNTKSMTTTQSIDFPKPNLSPSHPHKKVPIKAVTVLATRQYPKKWSSLIASM